MYRLSHLFKAGQLNLTLLEMIAKSLYYSTSLPVTILNKEGLQQYSIGADPHLEQLFPETLQPITPFSKNNYTNNGDGLFVFDTSYEFSYLTITLSYNHHYEGSLLLGPYTAKSITEHLINEMMNAHHFSLAQRETVKNFYGNMAIMSASRNYYIQQLVLSLLTNEEVLRLFPIDEIFDYVDDTKYTNKLLVDVEKSGHNYPLELLFLTKVKNGDLEKVIELFNEHIKAQYQNQNNTESIRSSKNKAISFSTLMARSIIEGGVEAEKSLGIEAYYRERIESSRTLKELVNLLEEMVIKYTNTILHLSNINHVSVIKNASKYVHMHLSEPIRLNDVANFVNLSPNYFSSLFKREMNLSFADYVNQTRIKESQYLLETTEYSILDIAISVGYNNQNYFTTIFRKFTGITPKQYRMRSTK